MDRTTSQPRVEFRRADCVRSRIHGLGQVLVGGRTPVVRLLGGGRVQVPAEDLTLISNEEFAAEIENRKQIEVWMMERVYGPGSLDRYPRPAWRQEPDGLWTDEPVALPDPRSSPEIDHVFLADDIGQDARVLTAEEAKSRTNVIQCMVTRVSRDGGI